MDEARIIVRQAIGSDRNFILSTWLKGNYFGSSYFRLIPQDIYYKNYSDHILGVLQEPGIEIDIACDERTPDWIVGFSVTKDRAIHWVYVKSDFRGKGIATLLLKQKNISEVKALTRIGRAISEIKGLIFNPF